MADLKPLGSEKLQGMDKIQRILEIARFKETIPAPVNETSRNEYKLTLADGNEYQIVREKSGYIIKRTLTESNADYIEPMQNRKYYSSYSQALRRLNLMAKEMNEIHENTEGVSLFGEQKKFVLKTPEKKNTSPSDDVENVPAPPAPAPMPTAPEASAPAPELPTPPSEDEPMPTGDDEMGMDDMDMGGDEGTTEPVGDEDHDEEVTFKTIQKLTGKLGQKLRTLNADEENEMSSKDIKYVINSILSALDLENLDENDREDISNKLEGTEPENDFDFGKEDKSEEPMDDEDMGDESIGGDDMGTDSEPVGFGEMDETWDDLGTDIANNTLMKGITPGQFSEEDDDDTHIGRIADSVFMESKVEDLLMGYFTITENEKKFNRDLGKVRQEERRLEKSKRNSAIKRLSESIEQEVASRRFLEEHKGATFVGRTNKKNLVFEMNNKQFKVTPKGNII